jgi:hypothetical protein
VVVERERARAHLGVAQVPAGVQPVAVEVERLGVDGRVVGRRVGEGDGGEAVLVEEPFIIVFMRSKIRASSIGVKVGARKARSDAVGLTVVVLPRAELLLAGDAR